MIIALSMVLLFGFTGYSIWRIYKLRLRLNSMEGMMIAMTIGMMASITFGAIAGLHYRPDLTIPTVGAVLFGMVCGYLSGKPVHIMAALDGMLSGIMGGMMGAMLGVMLNDSGTVMVLFIDVVFIFVLLVLHQLISEITKRPDKQQETVRNENVQVPMTINQSGLSLLHPLVFGIGILVIAAVFLYQYNGNQTSKQSQTNIHDHTSTQ